MQCLGVSSFHSPGQVPMRNLTEFLLPPTAPQDNIDLSTVPNATALRNLAHFVETVSERGEDPMEAGYVVDLGGSKVHWNKGYCPCITRSRGAARAFYLPWLSRALSAQELSMLQGIRPGEIPNGLVSERELGGLAGNAIPVDLLAPLIRNLLTAAGLI